MIQMDLKVEGLERFRSRMGAAPKQLETAERGAIKKSLELMRARGKTRASAIAVGPRLANSIQMSTASNGLTGEVASLAATAVSIEQGRARGEHVRVGLILGWMARKGVVTQGAAAAGARQSVKTHALVNRRKQGVAAAQRHLAWKIAMAIGAAGTKPLPFLTPVAKESLADVRQYFQDAVRDALRRLSGR